MTINEALQYVLDEGRKMGYSYSEMKLWQPEIIECLYKLEDTDKQSVDALIEDLL